MIQLIFFTRTGFCEKNHKNYTTLVKKGSMEVFWTNLPKGRVAGRKTGSGGSG